MLATERHPKTLAMKQSLRTQMREKRKTLSPALYAEKTKLIHEKFLELPEYKDAEDLLLYLAKADEIQTDFLIKSALKDGKNVYVPSIQGDQLIICPFNETTAMQIGPFGVPEPIDQEDSCHPKQIDLIIVPGLAFDHKGHRLGYGKGYYDRFLKQTEAFKIGLALDEFILNALPTEAHDVPLDLILSESSTYKPSS